MLINKVNGLEQGQIQNTAGTNNHINNADDDAPTGSRLHNLCVANRGRTIAFVGMTLVFELIALPLGGIRMSQTHNSTDFIIESVFALSLASAGLIPMCALACFASENHPDAENPAAPEQSPLV